MEILNLIALLGGGLFGAIVKMISISMDNKQRQTELLISLNQEKRKGIQEVNELADKNKGFAWTRRVIAIMVTLMVASLIVLPFIDPSITVNVLTTATEGGSYLFGLIDTTNTKEVYQALKGIVYTPEITQAFLAIIGCYFGSSSVVGGRR